MLNPLLLAAVPLGLWYASGKARAGRPLFRLLVVAAIGGVFAIIMKAMPGFDQDIWSTVLLVCPTVAGLSVRLRLAERGVVPALSGRKRHSLESIDLPIMPSARIASTHALPWSITR